jgi:hypothetical protein
MGFVVTLERFLTIYQGRKIKPMNKPTRFGKTWKSESGFTASCSFNLTAIEPLARWRPFDSGYSVEIFDAG